MGSLWNPVGGKGSWAPTLLDHVLCRVPASNYILMCFFQNKWMSASLTFKCRKYIMWSQCKMSMWIYIELTLYYLSTHGNLFKHIQCDLRFQFFFVSCCGSRYITYLLVWLVYQLGSVKTICIMIDALRFLFYLLFNHSQTKCTMLIIFNQPNYKVVKKEISVLVFNINNYN